jgi:hypothetical protein
VIFQPPLKIDRDYATWTDRYNKQAKQQASDQLMDGQTMDGGTDGWLDGWKNGWADRGNKTNWWVLYRKLHGPWWSGHDRKGKSSASTSL